MGQIITGATGALGAHLVSQFISRTDFDIVALVRASDDVGGVRRVLANLNARKLTEKQPDRLTVLAANLTQEKFGLSEDQFSNILSRTQIVVHVGIYCLPYFIC